MTNKIDKPKKVRFYVCVHACVHISNLRNVAIGGAVPPTSKLWRRQQNCHMTPNWWASNNDPDHSLLSSRNVAVDVRKSWRHQRQEHFVHAWNYTFGKWYCFWGLKRQTVAKNSVRIRVCPIVWVSGWFPVISTRMEFEWLCVLCPSDYPGIG